MAKEKVIIFEGEHKFVAPRTHTFDTAKGEATYVGGNGKAETDVVTPSSVMPIFGESDYCNRLQAYISSRGENTASPEQVMIAYQNFQTNCLSTSTTTETTTLVSTETTTSTTTNTTTLAVILPPPPPIVPLGFGIAPPRGGGGGGGGSDTPVVAPKKSYWWLLLVAAGAYLLFSKKK
jgi:hypothetical protein